MSAAGTPAGLLEQAEELVHHASEALLHTAEALFALPERPASRWHRAGLSPRAERVFDVVSGFVLALFAIAWTWSLVTIRAGVADGADEVPPTPSIAAALTDADAPIAPFANEAVMEMLTPLRGASGKLRANILPRGGAIATDSLPRGAQLKFSSGEVAESTSTQQAPTRSGIWDLAVKVGNGLRPLTDFSVITLLPLSVKRRGEINGYRVGSWPFERARTVRPGYEPPSGFIEVTQDNADTPLSDHFTLRDFLTHDQQNVWPKYLVLQTRLIDKLELVLDDLRAHGVNTDHVVVMSGFRTPQYNVTGGDPTGRAALSRHMYGDAADIFIDNDRNGTMDDLNHDGRINLRDSQVILDAVERVEAANPALVGGCGIYVANGEHGPFVHIDARGYRARWLGQGDS